MTQHDQWYKGPPPSEGWWPASDRRDPGVLRWWNGSRWGRGVHVTRTAKEAGRAAHEPAWGGNIEWRHRPADWPEHSKT